MNLQSIEVTINPKLEFMNSVLMTSHYNEMTIPYVGFGLMCEDVNDYTEAIRSHFRGFLDHPVYAFVEELIPKGFMFARPVELMLSLEDLTFQRKHGLSPLCVDSCGGDEKIEKFLILLQDLYIKCDYDNFFQKNVCFYNEYLEKARTQLKRCDYRAAIEDEMGQVRDAYGVVLSTLMNGNFGIYFADALYSVFAINDFSLSPGVIFHEFLHPFVNPLTDKFKEEVNGYLDAYERLKPYKRPGFESGYGDWTECVNEHLVRALSAHLLNKNNFSQMAKENAKREVAIGYRYVPYLLDALGEYDSMREVYTDFSQYYLKILQVFQEPILDPSTHR